MLIYPMFRFTYIARFLTPRCFALLLARWCCVVCGGMYVWYHKHRPVQWVLPAVNWKELKGLWLRAARPASRSSCHTNMLSLDVRVACIVVHAHLPHPCHADTVVLPIPGANMAALPTSTYYLLQCSSASHELCVQHDNVVCGRAGCMAPGAHESLQVTRVNMRWQQQMLYSRDYVVCTGG